MITLEETPANQKKLGQLKQSLARLLQGTLKHGFYGKVAVEWTVQDGTIQHITSRIEETAR